MKRALARLLLVIGIATIAAATTGVVALCLLVRHGLSARDQPSTVETVVATAIRRWSVPTRDKARQNPVTPTAEVLAQARAHWADHCAVCHANDGSGQTEIGRSLYPKPPDMRQSSTQAQSDGELYYVIQNGVRLTGMPAWGEAGHEDHETWALVAFIRTLPKLTADDLKQMEQLNPRSVAMDHEREEEEEFLMQPKDPPNPHQGSH